MADHATLKSTKADGFILWHGSVSVTRQVALSLMTERLAREIYRRGGEPVVAWLELRRDGWPKEAVEALGKEAEAAAWLVWSDESPCCDLRAAHVPAVTDAPGFDGRAS